ncbi:hypothetical protein Cni_G08949 [Canna indica]|uniref:C2H2-type domain-containing protein n=1 Tax=Canna indica TaxID=4628 RepID=A0AAQ3K743_9LILI|nr:hypothetical protein Cni_G08949 [Canna indica]
MDKHRCNLCFRRFSSGRALGGHMRGHVTAGDVAAEGAEEEDVIIKEAAYGLRENPRKSFRLVDPEFSSAAAEVEPAGSSSVVVEDGESETESPWAAAAAASHRRRTKRPRDPESASSASDVTTDEDVARCLLMLSRDSWTGGKEPPLPDGEDEEGSGRRIAISSAPPRRGRSKYRCGTCKKVFRSYQALGGHRASHQRPDGCVSVDQSPTGCCDDFGGNASGKVHECPFCFRVFASGQALGGHKRSHYTMTSRRPPPMPYSAPATSMIATAKYGASFGLIDLNLPAPVDDESALSLSAVSDAEFISNRAHTSN